MGTEYRKTLGSQVPLSYHAICDIHREAKKEINKKCIDINK